MAEPPGDERAGDSENDGDDASAGVAPGHQQLGEGAGKPADDDPADDSVMLHSRIPFFHAGVVQPAFTKNAATRACKTSAVVSRKALAPGEASKLCCTRCLIWLIQ